MRLSASISTECTAHIAQRAKRQYNVLKHQDPILTFRTREGGRTRGVVCKAVDAHQLSELLMWHSSDDRHTFVASRLVKFKK